MNCLIILLLRAVYCVLFFSCFVSAALDDALRNYEILDHGSFRHQIKRRDLYTRNPVERHVTYDTLGKHFDLVLHRDTSVIANDFRVIAVDENQVERVVDFQPAIYHGYLADERATSFVSAYWEDDNALHATVRTSTDVYAVEPAWRHLENSSESSMISYRESDLLLENHLGERFCGYVKEDMNVDETESRGSSTSSNSTEHIEGLRVKRASSCSKSYENPVCGLLLVADYRFYKSVGMSNIQKTTNYLISLIDRIHAIYVDTSFGSCGTGFGFEIREIRILQSPTDGGTDGNFNMDKTNWDTNELLEMFSRDSYFNNFCLSHLFTAISFDNGVLGLAYIGGSKPYSVGGVCSPSYFKGGYRLFLNTGWSSALSRNNRNLLTLEATLVTAHEFGHNWGSEHDPDTNECSPSASSGGKHIMYTYSVSGLDTNNKLFSPCSRRSIGAVLEAKAGSCFKQRSSGFCGNLKVEEGEQCDPGSNQNDACCDTTCRLKPKAVCSDMNDLCCTSCQLAPSSKVCATEQENTCQGQAKCSGTSKTCPSPPNKANGSKCNEQSMCLDGTCESLCEYYGQYSCICDGEVNACRLCCRSTASANGSTCAPYNNSYLSVGMPCFRGICNDKGECEKRIQNNMPRLWEIIDHVTVNELVIFMRANIVGTIIVLSLIIWIPICCIISYVDYKRKYQHKRLNSMDSLTDETIKPNIKPASSIKSRRLPGADDRKPLLI